MKKRSQILVIALLISLHSTLCGKDQPAYFTDRPLQGHAYLCRGIIFIFCRLFFPNEKT